jgi:transketolase
MHGGGDVEKGAWDKRNLNFGIREHAMASICNGLSLHGGVVPYCATFLTFHDYMRPAVRLAAIMHRPVVYVYTHDSVWLGEDGPTHQPIEHLMAMRAMPNLWVVRPRTRTRRSRRGSSRSRAATVRRRCASRGRTCR